MMLMMMMMAPWSSRRQSVINPYHLQPNMRNYARRLSRHAAPCGGLESLNQLLGSLPCACTKTRRMGNVVVCGVHTPYTNIIWIPIPQTPNELILYYNTIHTAHPQHNFECFAMAMNFRWTELFENNLPANNSLETLSIQLPTVVRWAQWNLYNPTPRGYDWKQHRFRIMKFLIHPPNLW